MNSQAHTTRRPFVFDLGANTGLNTQAYMERGYSVVAVEPSAEAFQALRQRIAPLKEVHGDGVICVETHAAITQHGDDALLYTSTKHQGETHSLDPARVKDASAVPEKVRGMTVPELIARYGVPHFIKMDMEGAEVVAIRQLHGWVNSQEGCGLQWYVPYLQVELSWDHPEEAIEIFSHLAYMGYDRFELSQQQQPDGKAGVDHFGKDQHYDFTLSQVIEAWFSDCNFTKRLGWYDLHAKHKDAP